MAKQTFTTGQVLTAAQMTSLQQTAMGGGSTTAKTASYTLVAADAGTVVQMNSASATTITVNTGLFAAGDTVQIQNIGAGVCTVTAGTATVNTIGSLALSQYAGGELYFNTTSAAFFYGVDAAASSGGMTLLSTTTLSGTTTSVSVTSTGYKNLVAYVSGAGTGASNYNYGVRVNSISANYVYKNTSAVSGGSILNTAGSTSTIDFNQPGYMSCFGANTLNTFVVTIFDVNSSRKKLVTVNGSYINMDGTNLVMTNDCVATDATSAITNISVISNTSLTSGTIEVYGVK
jgi:hypothetical protein